MKSAYELAMERLEKQTPAAPKLTDAQKTKIAELDSLYRSKIAEREISLRGQSAHAMSEGRISDADSLRLELAADIRRLNEECERRKEKVREEAAQ